MSTYFTANSLKFLRALARHNNREWFLAHKADYENHIRAPFQRLLTDLQPAVAAISPNYRSESKTVGGSMFRIQRDTRFASDKAPYKPWQGARIFHERRKQVAAPSFYLHLQPGASFIGAGLWHPETHTQRRVRQFIFDNPGAWARVAHDKKLKKRFDMASDQMLVRPPPGFPTDFTYIDDLRHKNFALIAGLDDAEVTSNDLNKRVEKDLVRLAPFVDYLCAAQNLEF